MGGYCKNKHFAALGILTSIFKQVRGSNDAEMHRVTAKQGPRTRKKALTTKLKEIIGAKKGADGTPWASGRTPALIRYLLPRSKKTLQHRTVLACARKSDLSSLPSSTGNDGTICNPQPHGRTHIHTHIRTYTCIHTYIHAIFPHARTYECMRHLLIVPFTHCAIYSLCHFVILSFCHLVI